MESEIRAGFDGLMFGISSLAGYVMQITQHFSISAGSG
jgi:hypothetical protein